MKKLNILVTAVGGDIGGNIINILSNQAKNEICLIGTDIKEDVFILDKLDKFFQVSRTNEDGYKEQLFQILLDNSIDILIPVSENEIIWFNKNIELFKDLDLKILINNQEIISTFLNKLETSIALKTIGVQTPKTYLLNNYIDQLIFPIIVKSTYSINNKDLYILESKEQLSCLKKSLSQHENYIVQQYIGSINDEYTTTVYQNKHKLEVITFKRDLTGGMTSFATISNEKVLFEYAKNIANKYNLSGSINIQSRKIGTEFYIFEINPRFSSTIYIRDHFNFKDLLWWINHALGRQVFKLSDKQVSEFGKAILGYQYKFINKEDTNVHR